jgi:hypothetical protein
MKDGMDERYRRQHGVIGRGDALADGLTRSQIRGRVRSGAWLEPMPGVYRHPAHPVTPEQQIMASVLSAGPPAVASHQAAAYLWGLLTWSDVGGHASVTVPLPAHPRAYGFDVHRVGHLDWGRVRVWKAIECTDPIWTVVDLAGVVTGTMLDQAVDRGLATRRFTIAGLQAEVARRAGRGRRGVGRLRDRLELRGLVGAPQPSVLESRAIRFLRRYHLPVLRSEVVVGDDGEYRVDFHLVEQVMWEVDGYAWHFTPEQMTRDNARRDSIRLSGIDLYVDTWHSLVANETAIARKLRLAVANACRRQLDMPSRVDGKLDPVYRTERNG